MQYLTSTTVNAQERTNVLKCRTGTLYTAKWAKRFDPSQDGACPLCGQLDNTERAISGCPCLSEAVTNRHHKTARIIIRAISNGRLGADLVLTDVGKRMDTCAMGIPYTGRHLSRCYIPSHLWERSKHTSIPDAVLIHTKSLRKDGLFQHCQNLRATIVEFKFCTDMDPTKQQNRATAQHINGMKALLEEAGYQVTQQNITLGTRGTVYKTSPEQLQALGVEKKAALTALRQAHLQAVHSLTDIINCRRALIHQHHKQKPHKHKCKGGAGGVG